MDASMPRYKMSSEDSESLTKLVRICIQTGQMLHTHSERPELQRQVAMCAEVVGRGVDYLVKVAWVMNTRYQSCPGHQRPPLGGLRDLRGVSQNRRLGADHAEIHDDPGFVAAPVCDGSPVVGEVPNNTFAAGVQAQPLRRAHKPPSAKADLLSRAIQRLAEEFPGISIHKLHLALFGMREFTFLDSRECKTTKWQHAKYIVYANSRGKLKTVLFSCLKDRLCRANKVAEQRAMVAL